MKPFMKPLLIIIGIIQILLMGLPALLASQTMADLFNVDHAAGFEQWVRWCGMANIMWGLMLIGISADPVRNKIVVCFSIIFYLFCLVLTLMMMFWFGELDPAKLTWWIPVVFPAIFIILLIVYYPKERAA